MPSAIATAPPSSGISEAEAIDLARSHTSFDTFVSAFEGPWGDRGAVTGIGPDHPIQPDDLVWEVELEGDMTICNPAGTCYAPRPSFTVVFIDSRTGTFLSSEGWSPAP